MAFDDDLAALGVQRVLKKRYFALCDEDGNLVDEDSGGGVSEVSFVDCNGVPIQPHVLVPPGASVNIYNEDARAEIDRKIKDREKTKLSCPKKGI